MQQIPSSEGSGHIEKTIDKKISALEYAQKINYTLYDISNAVNKTRNLEQLYHSIYQSLNRLMPLPNFFIAMWDKKKKTINFDYFIDECDDDFPIVENSEEPNCLTGEVILEKRPLFLKENMLIQRAKKKRLIGSIPKIWLGVPLIIQDAVIGAIAVQHYSDSDYFTHQHMEVLISVSEQIALAIERKQIFQALKKREKTISLITDNTSSIIAIIDAHGVFEFANPAHKKLGYNCEKLPGASFFDLMHPDEAMQLINFLGKGITGHASHLTLEFRIKNNLGNFQPILGTFDLIKNREGFTEKLIFIGEDISVRKKNQKAIKEIEERFRLIFDSSPDAIIITQLESGKIFDVNTAFTRLCGMKKDDLIGQVTTDLGIWENTQQRSNFIAQIQKKGTYENLEETLIFRGNPIKTLISSKPLMLDGQHHLLSIIRDISNRKNLGSRLARQQKTDAIGTLAGSVAHDFNNLLSIITGHLEYLNTDDRNLKEPQKDSIDNALIASKKAAKLVRQLQSLTRTDESIPGPVDLAIIANDVFTILGQTTNPLIEKRNELIENQYFVLGFEDELHQALMNIGINATQAIELLKDSSNGTIRLYAPSDDAPLPPSPLARDKSFLHICFEDTGCGMSPEIQKQAFDPMFTTWPVTGNKNLGMGLAMVDNIITKKHKGVVDIESQQDKGTTLHLYLPKASKPSSASEQRIKAPQKRETILVIDDEDMVRDMAVKSLTSFGYSTLEAPDGKAGVAIYKKNQNRIGAVLLDIIMPKMSGVETFKQLLMIDPQVKVIIASGHITNQDQKKLFAKACAYLDKPYQIIELKRALHRILD